MRQELRGQLDALPPKQLVYCGSNDFAADGSFRPSVEPREVQVLRRGLVSAPIEPAVPGAIDYLESKVSYDLEEAAIGDEAARRVALARWLVAEGQPLSWRVMANRIWLQHFGSGIVTTPNDFGRMGAAPSHPWVLDHLASELRDSGSIKRVHRLLLLSSTYQLSTEGNDANAAIDGAAVFRWRMPRRRLDAESVRDGLLQISGSLDSHMGGPSVRQFVESPGIHVTPVVDYESLPLTDPAFRRRSVYRFIFRTVPDPFFDSLDCPDASQWTPQRNTSLTAVQALATLHDRQVALAAERLTIRLEHEVANERARVSRLFELLFARRPVDEEIDLVLGFTAEHGWPAACLYLMNTNEFHFLD